MKIAVCYCESNVMCFNSSKAAAIASSFSPSSASVRCNSYSLSSSRYFCPVCPVKTLQTSGIVASIAWTERETWDIDGFFEALAWSAVVVTPLLSAAEWFLATTIHAFRAARLSQVLHSCAVC